MIAVIARNYVRLNQMTEFLKIASGLVEATRKEEGCINYLVFRDEDKEILSFVEIWKDKPSLHKHLNAEHFKAYVKELEPMQYAKTKLEIFDDHCL